MEITEETADTELKRAKQFSRQQVNKRGHHGDKTMTLGNRSFEEKRSFIRMKIDAMVSFSIEGKQERYEGRCKNISGAGLLLESAKKLPLGTRIQVTIPSESRDLDNLQATVEIIRVIPHPDQHKYELGGVILQVKP
jgi:hypothetical protein